MGGYSLNLFRLFSSGALLLFALYCLIFDRTLPFSMPTAVLIVATVYLAVFPVKDMLYRFNRTLYKGRQFAKNYEKTPMLDEVEFQRMKKQYDRRAWYAMLFWLAFLAAVGGLYAVGVFDRAWIFFFFAFWHFKNLLTFRNQIFYFFSFASALANLIRQILAFFHPAQFFDQHKNFLSAS